MTDAPDTNRQRRSRLDGWINAIMGFGGVRDKTEATVFGKTIKPLSVSECASMFASEHLSAKICDVYPKEAMREGYQCGGYEQDQETKIAKYLEPWQIDQRVTRAAIWGNVFGGSAIWLGSVAGNPEQPLRPGEKIDFLRVIDRRYLTVQTQRDWIDNEGNPVYYQVNPQDASTNSVIRTPTGAAVTKFHRSRLVLFPGALTDDQIRIQLGYWDLSALQRPYDQLKSDGNIWKAVEHLVSEASIGILKIKNLYTMTTGGQRDRLQDRIGLMNLARSVAHMLTLDADKEDFTRVNTTFAGVSDISMQSIKRIASAAEIPVTVLLGEAPAGLNATGDSDLRWFLMRVNAYRRLVIEPRLRQLLVALLSQEGSPVQNADDLMLKWPPLWTPSAKEQSEIYQNTANGDAIYLDRQVVVSEEIGLSRFGDDGYSQETEIKRELREGYGDAPPAEGATGPTGPDAPADANTPADEAMNGAQISAIIEVVSAVGEKKIPRDSGVAILEAALGGDKAQAEQIMGSTGKGFEPAPPEPAPGGFPPKEAPPDPTGPSGPTGPGEDA